jgi:hypothetical protein
LKTLRTLNVRRSPKTEEEKERNGDEIRLNRTLTKLANFPQSFAYPGIYNL